MRRINFTASLFAAMMFAACTKEVKEDAVAEEQGQANTSNRVAENSRENFVPDEMIVKFKEGTTAKGIQNAIERIGANVKEHIVTEAMKHVGDEEGIYLVNVPIGLMNALQKAKGQSEVLYAEPNYIYTHDATSNDTYFKNGSLWGMYGDASLPANQYGSQAAEAWSKGNTGSSSVYVGVIDEGIQYTHPDLSGQVWTNPFDKADGIDNDGNGYVDDIHGWDFAGNNNSIYDGGNSGNADDHGTHVSGTIGAKSNSSGVVGVNWNITIISCKFLGRNGGTTANAVKAVDYLNRLKTLHGLNIVASNNSWGGGGYSQSLYDAINRANTNNILFIAAAGNGGSDGVGDNIDSSPSYPASYSNANIISVAAITSTGGLTSWSNYGKNSVDIGAPGSGIYSTTAYNTYSSYSGTSMATPHVTGGAALYASTHAGASAATIKSAILSSAVPTSSLNGKTVTGGRLNVSGF